MRRFEVWNVVVLTSVGLAITLFLLYGYCQRSAEPVVDVYPGSVPAIPYVPPVSRSSSDKLWGAYEARDFSQLQNKVGKKADIEAVFLGWGDSFPLHETHLKAHGQILFIFWEQYGVTLDQILGGSQDAYIAQFAADAKTYDGEVRLAPFSEMNGEWSPWGGVAEGNTPAKVIEAWKHIHALFADASNVEFVWVVNQESVPDTPENSIASYYPGDEFVDYVGVDGFNFGKPWQTYDQIFTSALMQLRKYDKPILVTSMSCAPGQQKSTWIKDALFKIYADPDIVGFVWFNENKEGQGEWEANWLVDSDHDSLEEFRNAVK